MKVQILHIGKKKKHEVRITIFCSHTNKATILDLINYKNSLVKNAVT